MSRLYRSAAQFPVAFVLHAQSICASRLKVCDLLPLLNEVIIRLTISMLATESGFL